MGSLFFWPAPVLLKQGYLVITGVVTAYMFTFVPEWTTWTLLIAMALYDLYAVLTPGGPLKVAFLHESFILNKDRRLLVDSSMLATAADAWHGAGAGRARH